MVPKGEMVKGAHISSPTSLAFAINALTAISCAVQHNAKQREIAWSNPIPCFFCVGKTDPLFI
jgi:hypothetical protein